MIVACRTAKQPRWAAAETPVLAEFRVQHFHLVCVSEKFSSFLGKFFADYVITEPMLMFKELTIAISAVCLSNARVEVSQRIRTPLVPTFWQGYLCKNAIFQDLKLGPCGSVPIFYANTISLHEASNEGTRRTPVRL